MTFRCDDLDAALRGDELAAARAHAVGCAECRERLRAWDQISELAPSLKRDWPTPGLWLRIEDALAAAGSVVLQQRAQRRPELAEQDRKLLTERALAAVERSETEYIASIEALAKLAAARLETPASPLLASYREKLQILDAAIADCRAQVERNRFNAHLRGELLSIYREKQRTLQMLMDDKS
jgi:hypothetical protein